MNEALLWTTIALVAAAILFVALILLGPRVNRRPVDPVELEPEEPVRHGTQRPPH